MIVPMYLVVILLALIAFFLAVAAYSLAVISITLKTCLPVIAGAIWQMSDDKKSSHKSPDSI